MEKSDKSFDAPVKRPTNSVHPLRLPSAGPNYGEGEGLSALRRSVGSCISDKKIETVLLLIIILYSVLIFIRLGIEDDYEEMTVYLNLIELFILLLFCAEFLLKIYAFRSRYFKDCWNCFDMFIVLLCLVLTIIDLTAPGQIDYKYFRLSGTLRLLRLVVLFRRLNLMRKIAQIKKARGHLKAINVSTSAEKVVEILETVLKCDVPDEVKAEIRWALLVISQNTLFELNIEARNESERQKVKEWIDVHVQQHSVFMFDGEASVPQLNISIEIENRCSTIHTLNFDIFEFGEDELLCICLFIFKEQQLLGFTDPGAFKNFVHHIQKGYKDNPYHNARHAADVVQFFYFLLHTCEGVRECGLEVMDESICLLSAAIHDYEHPGVNNNFLINSSSELATRYNDKAVLENHHLAAAFAVAKDPEKNIFKKLNAEQFKSCRAKMIAIVLATDMARHFEDHGKFKNRFSTHHELKDEADKLQIMEAMMHASDISNPTRPWNICKQWSFLLIEEFFAQGDQEKKLGIPVSHLCDRKTVDLPSSQIGFIDVIIEPTFLNLGLVLPLVNQLVLPNIYVNKENWSNMGNNHQKDN